MRTIKVTILALASCAILAVSGEAQQAFVGGVTLGAAAPTSTLGDIVKTGGGGAVFIGRMVGNGMMLKFDAGYYKFSSEELTFEGGLPFEVDGGVVPIRIGFRKYWGESKRFYTGPNIGIYAPAGDISDLDSHFGIGPQVGFRFPAGQGSIDVVAEFHTIFVGDENPLTNGEREFFDDDKVSFFTFGLAYTVGSIGN